MRKNGFLISICIPTYNRPEYLKRLLKSIISQKGFKGREFELLIIDNASLADIGQILKPFCEKYDNIRFIRNRVNIGGVPNFIKLLRNFRGQYFFYLSDDDKLLAGALLKLKRMVNKNPEVALFTSAYKNRNYENNKISTVKIFDKSKIIYKEDIRSIVKFYGAGHSFSRVCIKRDSIDINGYIRHRKSSHGQMYFMGKAALSGKSYYSNNPLILRTVGNPYFWKNTRDFMMREHIEIIKDLARINPDFYDEAMKERMSYIPDQFYARFGESLGSGFSYLIAILKIPDIGKNPQVLILLSREMFGNTFLRLFHKLAGAVKTVFSLQ